MGAKPSLQALRAETMVERFTARMHVRASENTGTIQIPKAMQIRHVQAKLVRMKNRCAARSPRVRLTWT